MAVNIPGTIAATIVTTCVMTYLLRATSQPPTIDGDSLHLTLPKRIRVAAVAGGWLFAGGAVAIVAALCLGAGDAKLQRVAWFAVPLFALLGIACLLESRVHLVADKDGIRGRTAWRGTRAVQWDELVIVYYSPGGGFFKLVDKHKQCVRVSRYLQGHETIVALMAERLPRRVVSKAMEKYQNARTAGY